MKTCIAMVDISSGAASACGNLCEGTTDFCAHHNRQRRKDEENYIKAQQKRKALLSKPKKIYAKPNKVSPKREELNKEYKVLREQFLKEHPNCELKLQPCTKVATEVHHTASGWNKATNLNNVKTWKASCSSCNQFLHDKISAKEARELGLKI